MKIIELKDVWMSYDVHPVLENVNLWVEEGEFVSLIGPNGGGKTTILKLILGIIKPTRGEVKVFGKNPQELDREWDWVGYVPQRSNVDWRFPIRVEDVVLMDILARKPFLRRATNNERDMVNQALKKLGIFHLRKRPIGELSGGEQQRVFIARAIAKEPKLLLLDEPTTGVDIRFQHILQNILKELHENGTTIVLVSHDIGVVSKIVQRIVCVNKRVHAHLGEFDEDHLCELYGGDVGFLTHGEGKGVRLREHD
jgi:zinc transport system ATP-binding protein